MAGSPPAAVHDGSALPILDMTSTGPLGRVRTAAVRPGAARQAKGGAREGCPYSKTECTEAGASTGAVTPMTS